MGGGISTASHYYWHFGDRCIRAKRDNQNYSPAKKSELIELFLCDTRRQKRSILGVCEHFGNRCIRAKRANQNYSPAKKSELIELFLCDTRRQKRSILGRM